MRFCAAIFLFSLIFAVSCTSTQPRTTDSLDAAGKLIPSGFLSNYSELTPSRNRPGAYVYVNSKANLRLYQMVMLDPVQVHLHPDAAAANLHPDTLKRIALDFERDIRDALGDSFPIVQQPGGRVLRIRAAITDIKPSNPTLNSIPLVRLAGHGLGGASVEVEFIDSVSNKQVAAFVDSDTGKLYRRTSGLTKYGDAEDRLREWSLLLRDRLDVIRGLHTDADLRGSGDLYR